MKKAVIVGASGGLGSEITRLLQDRGIIVVNISRSPSAAEVNIACDITSNVEIADAIETVREQHADADVLIVCSGVLHHHPIGQYPVAEIDEDFAVNITGCIKIVDGLARIIKRNRGDIVLVGSTSSFTSHVQESTYVAAKHAILGYAKSLQAEFKKDDVRVIGFYPGGMRSAFHLKAHSDLRQEDLMDPKDCAKLLLTLLGLPRNMEVSEILINRKAPSA